MNPGRDEEFTEYVAVRLGALRRIAYLLCQDWHRADDLVQISITRLYVHWGRARAVDYPDAYARTILVREYLSEQRSGWARRVSLDVSLPDRPDHPHDADAALDVRSALAAIAPRQRTTLVLRFYCDLSVEQAAALLGCSEGTVKSQTAKGIAALRDRLGPDWNAWHRDEPGGPAGPGDTSQPAGIFHLISLRVWPAGLCQVTGPMTGKAPRPSPGGTASGSSGNQGQDGETTYPNGLTCNDNLARTPLTGPAADVNGAPAYRTPAHGLVWEYARGAWAVLNFPQMLTPTTHQAMLYQIASSVRYGYPAAVGYGFTISGLPANWQPGQAGASYNVAWLDGRLVNVGWSAGPAQDPGALNLFINPANTPGGMSSCKFIAGQSSYVTIDGVQATLRTIDEPSEYWQSLCLSDIDGLAFYATLDLANPDTNAPLPGGAQVGSLVTVFSHLRLLGPDPTGWTTSPPA